MMEVSLQLLRGTALARILVERRDTFSDEMNVQRESVDLPLSEWRGISYHSINRYAIHHHVVRLLF